MPQITFKNGKKVNFIRQPNQTDIEEVAKLLGIPPEVVTENRFGSILEALKGNLGSIISDIENTIYKDVLSRIVSFFQKQNAENEKNAVELERIYNEIKNEKTVNTSQIARLEKVINTFNENLTQDISNVKSEVKTELKTDVSDKIGKINSRITDLEEPVFHRKLRGILPDQHHAEKHTLESHLDTDLIKKVFELISGKETSLHTHKEFKAMTKRPKQIHGGAPDTYICYSIGTGDGTTKTFTLPAEPLHTAQVLIHVGANVLPSLSTNDYFSISGKTVTLVTAPRTGYNVAVTMQAKG